MTLQKVAKKAGVSVSTASKALADSKEVSEETRILVRNAAKELGYFEEAKKRRLTNRRKTAANYAILCPEIISVHYSELVTEFCRKVDEKGGKASVFITEFDSGKKTTMLDRCLSQKDIDAILCLESINGFEAKNYPLPIVFTTNQKNAPSVYAVIKDGIDKAVKYLADIGHTKIAYAGEPLTEGKKIDFCECMERYVGSYRKDLLFVEDGRFEVTGNKIARRILECADKPTAIVAAYDEIAYGLVHTLRNGGVRIPEDISVIGFNDIPTSKFLETPLTTVNLNTKEVVSKAIELLEKQLTGEASGNESIAIECDLIVRKSTAACNYEK